MIHRNIQFVTLLGSGLIFSSSAAALGIGAAETTSYIGEPLSVRIPLFNVSKPDSLNIKVDSEQFDGLGQPQVNATLDRSNSQLVIRLSSNDIINEPYISFTLDLVDSDGEFTKEFIVLMDLPKTQASAAVAPRASLNTEFQSGSDARSAADEPHLGESVTYSSELMGPYDTAKVGQIPKKFGAVLNGQSLWRVARRINRAMGVTKSQMIWALYVANPNAFSSKSITSLKAGVFLDIPNQSAVQSISDEQAQANLRALRANFNRSKADQAIPSLAVGDNESQEGDYAQSQKIISTLTETINSMSQQLERKDQKIEFLESQVNELSNFIAKEGVGENSTEGVGENLAVVAETSLDAIESVQGIDEVQVITGADELALTEKGRGDTTKELSATAAVNDQAQNKKITMFTSVWQWLLLGLVLIGVLIFLIRDRVFSLVRSLNLFGSNEHVDLRSEMLKEDTELDLDSIDDFNLDDKASIVSKSEISDVESELHNHDDVTESVSDMSILRAVEESLADPETLSTMSYLDIADDEDAEELLDFEIEKLETELKSTNDADLSFDERFEQLLSDKDFNFARELLDFARYNEIDDDRYHCERLRIYEKMKDEDAFYEYYYEIESKIPTFSQSLQTQISQLVVQLANY